MSPLESCHSPRLILDDVGMGTKGLVVRKEGCYVQAFEDEMGNSPIHNKFMCCCGLEIGLRKAKYFFKKITGAPTLERCHHLTRLETHRLTKSSI